MSEDAYQWHQPQCPICRQSINRREWRDEVWGASVLVETLEHCDACGYELHDAYGHVLFTIGAKQFGYSFSDSRRRQAAVAKQAKRAVRHARRVLVQSKRKPGLESC